MESSFRFYPPNLTTFDDVVKTSGEVAADLLKMRYQFMQYARLFATQDKIDDAIGKTKMFEGLGIPPEQYQQAINSLTQEEFLGKVVTNLATKFYNFLVSVDAFNGKVLFRQKFLRQSKEKNYAVIPMSTFDIWVESMDIPKEQSKIAYSDWEIKNKKDNPDPVASSKGQSTAEDATKASSLFKTSEGMPEESDTDKKDTPEPPKLFNSK